MIHKKILSFMLSLMLLGSLILPMGLAGASTTEVSLLNASVTKIYGTSNIIFEVKLRFKTWLIRSK